MNNIFSIFAGTYIPTPAVSSLGCLQAKQLCIEDKTCSQILQENSSEIIKMFGNELRASPEGDTESVMCDVIKIRLKRIDERRGGKGNP